MLKIFIVVGFVLVAVFYFSNNSFIKKQNTTPLNINSNDSHSPVPKNRIEITFDEREYVLVYEPLSGKTISLIPNFTQKRSAMAIAEENSCTTASSGGFYTKEDKPLGLFITGGKTFGKRVNTSSLLTGFFYVTSNGETYIDSEANDEHPIVLQSGPLFTSDKPFPTKTDEYARRNLVIEDLNGHEYITTIFSKENTYDGPQLTDMPAILFSIKFPFRVQRALNLDGGSASFFKLDNDFIVSEIVAVGSVLCIK
jgi:hypothetical protein